MATDKEKMIRTQICFSSEQYEAAKRIAEKRGVSMAEFMRNAVEREAAEEHSYDDPLADIIGMIKDADPNASEKLDEMIYGEDIH